MKYVIVIPDGCADEPVAELGNLTPLQAAKLPNMDRVARARVCGLSNNVPPSLTPASDVATLSLFGYDPLKYYTGRAPLETAAMGIHLGPNDWAVRCNLVHVPDGHMRDFTAGHIWQREADLLIADLNEKLGGRSLRFHTGVSYRNLMVAPHATNGKLHPLQQKFLEHAALQCGICTPGFIVAAKAVAFSGRSSPRSHWPTSIQWTIRSVRSPPPKSQNHRQFRNRYSSNG